MVTNLESRFAKLNTKHRHKFLYRRQKLNFMLYIIVAATYMNDNLETMNTSPPSNELLVVMALPLR